MSRHLVLNDIPVETRGHHQIYDASQPGRLNGTRLAAASISTVGDEDSLLDGFAYAIDGAFSCATCDAHPGFEVVAHPDGPEGIGLRAKTDCLLPEGAETTFTLTVRSGKIILADSLHEVFDADLPHAPGYNSAAGQILHSHTMAALGVAYGAVGSSGVDLVRLGDPSFGSARDGGRYALTRIDDEFDDDPDHDDDLRGFGRRDVLAHISTGIWAYSIADFEHWRSTAVAKGLDVDALLDDPHRAPQVIDFPNGVYLFVHHQTVADRDPEGGWWPNTYADITMISPRPRR